MLAACRDMMFIPPNRARNNIIKNNNGISISNIFFAFVHNKKIETITRNTQIVSPKPMLRYSKGNTVRRSGK